MSGDCDFGLIGLAVMGENLALNVESRGYKVAVYNRTTEKVDDLIKGRAAGKNFVGTHSIEEFVKSVKRPRKLMLLVKAGPAVDAIIESLIPLCEPGDIIIDGGNSQYFYLNLGNAFTSTSGNSAASSSSVITMDGSGDSNASGGTVVSYCLNSLAGFL